MNTTNDKTFQNIYPFATEMVYSYFKLLDIKDKNVFTVGSSLDQAFNALVLGANHVTVFDVNPNTEEFYKRKRNIILNHSIDEVYSKVLEIKDVKFSDDLFLEKDVINMNNYLQNISDYEKLQECLSKDGLIEFVTGDLFHLEETLSSKSYDRMIFSNVLQYLDMNLPKEKSNPYLYLKEKMDCWTTYLNEDGILQLLYLYSYTKEDLSNNNYCLSTYNLYSIISNLDNYLLDINWFANCFNSSTDAIVTYRKRR